MVDKPAFDPVGHKWRWPNTPSPIQEATLPE